jgi:glyoxylate reductase
MPEKVFVSRPIPRPGLDILEAAGLRVEVNPEDRVLTAEELVRSCREKAGLLCLLTDTIDRSFLDQAPTLKAIATMSVGYNHIDLEAAKEKGIGVANTPGVLTNATAELTWALILATARRIPESTRFLRGGEFAGWGPMLLLGVELNGKTLGIVGAGRIGTAVGLKAAAFGMKVVYLDTGRCPELEKRVGAEKLPLERLLAESDFVSLHVPLTEETRCLIGRGELRRMKPTAFLINTSRGPVIDEEALAEALREKEIAGAGLDVYEKEPHVHPGLLTLQNVVLLPHIGSATVETRSRMAVMAAENLAAMLAGKPPKNPVPLPR